MSLAHFVDRVVEYLSWLYGRQWEPWELAAVGSVALALLILFAGTHRKIVASERLSRERSPIIGIELARSKPRARSLKRFWKRYVAFAADSHASKQAEKPLKRQVSEVKAANERFRQEIAEISRTQERFKQELVVLRAANDQLQRQLTNSKQTERQLRQQVAELTVANRELRHQKRERERVEKVPVEGSEVETGPRKQQPPFAIEEVDNAAPGHQLRKRIQSVTAQKGKEPTEQQSG